MLDEKSPSFDTDQTLSDDDEESYTLPYNTTVVRLELWPGINMEQYDSWFDTITAISREEGWEYSRWGTDVYCPERGALFIGWKKNAPSTARERDPASVFSFSSIRYLLQRKPEIYTLFLPVSRDSFQCHKELTILRGPAAVLDMRLLAGVSSLSWQATSASMISSNPPPREMHGVSDGSLLDCWKQERVQILVWGWVSREMEAILKDPEQESTGDNDAYQRLVVDTSAALRNDGVDIYCVETVFEEVRRQEAPKASSRGKCTIL